MRVLKPALRIVPAPSKPESALKRTLVFPVDKMLPKSGLQEMKMLMEKRP